ncbi:RICIN domain-containing protein [Streptomyces iconiensis]|uniref:RICIN domain-containing protein n=1 Tax=Streptomyces iconiensis TaxID=1384038 RepID=A0ABT7A844_9ACTN|nr:RICIN domain-containing protein [Streptomyces iconiensis]MDJ1137505.1 RICIN domain-containing protein [Streptomyces iconiensis]
MRTPTRNSARTRTSARTGAASARTGASARTRIRARTAKRGLVVGAAAALAVTGVATTLALTGEGQATPGHGTGKGAPRAGSAEASRHASLDAPGDASEDASSRDKLTSRAAGAGAGTGTGTTAGSVKANPVRYVINRHSGKCLTVRGASTANTAIVNQYRCVGAKNQQWRLEPGGGTSPTVTGTVLRNVHSGKCLTAHRGVRKGAVLTQYECVAGANQSFMIALPRMNRTNLTAKAGTTKNLVVDVQGASKADNAPVIIWNNKNDDNQRWDLTRSP